MFRLGNAVYSRIDDIVDRASKVSSEIGPCWLILQHGDTYALTEYEPRTGTVLGKLTGNEDKRYIRALIEG